MTLTQLAIDDPDAFVAMVDKLRAAGVVKLGALVLGPRPHTPADREAVDPDAEAFRKHQTMFASSRIQPPFVPPTRGDGGRPRILVQRQARDEAVNATAKPQR